MLVPPRQDGDELLDQGAGSPADVRASLAEVWRLNLLFGGVAALTRHLYPRLREYPDPLTIVDLGAGSGGLALHLIDWARRNQIRLCLYLLDFSERSLAFAAANVAHSPNIHLVQADGAALPFAFGQVDYFISTLFLHHLPPESVIHLLADAYARSRRGIIMSDLVRGYLPSFGFRLVQPFAIHHPFTRHDGAVSFRRAYTPRELRAMAHQAGILDARVSPHFAYQMALVADKPHG